MTRECDKQPKVTVEDMIHVTEVVLMQEYKFVYFLENCGAGFMVKESSEEMAQYTERC